MFVGVFCIYYAIIILLSISLCQGRSSNNFLLSLEGGLNKDLQGPDILDRILAIAYKRV